MYLLKRLFTFFCFFMSAECASGQIITTVAGSAASGLGNLGDGGPATSANIGWFGGLAVDKWGNIYIADGNHHRVRKVDAVTGIITTVAGTGVAGYNGDSVVAISAQLNLPAGVSVDSFGNVYVSDVNNYRIRKVDVQTGMITNYVGNGIQGITGDSGPARLASVGWAGATTWDAFGNMYLSDSLCIRRVDASGIITTIAGNSIPGCSGDGGPALAASITSGMICTDRKGNVYVGFFDTCPSVRKIDILTGIITRVAGDHVSVPYSGDGTIATSCHLVAFGVAVDDTGNLYISDYGNNRIEKVDTFGIIHTIAGTGVAGFSGDSGLATDAQINHPENVVLDKCGNVYIADFGNRRVRKITYRPCPDTTTVVHASPANAPIHIYPNPVQNRLYLDDVPEHVSYSLTSLVGVVFREGALRKDSNEIDLSAIPDGIYYLKLKNGKGVNEARKIVKQ